MWKRIKSLVTTAFFIGTLCLVAACGSFYMMIETGNLAWLASFIPCSSLTLLFGAITWDEDRG
jgi:hypothetical protein